MVWCITCLSEGSRESAALTQSGKNNRQESDFAGRVNASTGSSPHFCPGGGENTALAFFGSFVLGKVLLHCRPHLCLVHSYDLLAFLTPFVFLLLHRLVTFSVKLSPSGTGCLLLSSLLRLSLLFGQRSTLLCLGYVQLWSLLVLFSHSFKFVGFTIFICIFVFMFQQLFFVPCFSSSFFVCCVCCVLLVFHSPRGKAPD